MTAKAMKRALTGLHPADEAWIRWFAAFTDQDEEVVRTGLAEYKRMVERFEKTGDPCPPPGARYKIT